MSHLHIALSDARREPAFQPPYVLVPFYGEKEWQLFDKHCRRSGSDGIKAIRDYVNAVMGKEASHESVLRERV